MPKWRTVTVFEGEMIQAGEVIVEGRVDSHMLLKLLGRQALAKYIIDEVQDVYRLQGVRINDKHIANSHSHANYDSNYRSSWSTLFLLFLSS